MTQPIDLGRTSTSVRDWATRLESFVESGALDHEIEHWQSVGSEPLPVTEAEESASSFELSAEETGALLRGAPAAYRTGINDVLLAALTWTLSRWTRTSAVTIDLEGHGREEVLDDVDLSRTVGWFTTMFPVRLEVGTTSNTRSWSTTRTSTRSGPRRTRCPRDGARTGSAAPRTSAPPMWTRCGRT
jgi:hypothetical protein